MHELPSSAMGTREISEARCTENCHCRDYDVLSERSSFSRSKEGRGFVRTQGKPISEGRLNGVSKMRDSQRS